MNTQQLFAQMALAAWQTQTGRATAWVNGLSEAQLLREIAPGKNRGIYVVGHLIAIHDAMHGILGTGTRAHTELDEAFLKNPDRAGLEMPAVATLKQYWNDVHQTLNNALSQLTPEQWFARHNAMTDEDFAKEPARNKLSVLINRTNHLAYHYGQLKLIR